MFNALNIAQTGLNASKYAVENVSNNIANENTPGYKKREVNLTEINNITLSAGTGVNADVYRITAEFMYGNLVGENSKYNYNTEISQILENAESLFAETEDSGLSANLNRYYQAVEDLRSEPSNEIYQANLAQSGEYLVESLQQLYTGIERIEQIKEQELNANIEKVNTILEDIGKINEKMDDYDVVSNDLLDKRDNLELELSKYVDTKVLSNNGEYELQIAGQTAVRYSTNIRSIGISNEQIDQTDKFTLTKSDGVILDKVKNYRDDTGAIQSRTFNDGDKVNYTLNSSLSVSVTIGEDLDYFDENGDPATMTVSEDNLIRALSIAINGDPNIRNQVTAYNGNYTVNKDGEKVDDNTVDKFLLVESDIEGLSGKFESRISIESINQTGDISRENIYKSELSSIEASNRNSLDIFGSEVKLSSGIIKAQIEMTDSTSPINRLQSFKQQLDTFANALADIGRSFYKNDISGEYVYGTKAGDEYKQLDQYGSSTANIVITDPSDISSVTINIAGSDVELIDTAPSTAIADATDYTELSAALQSKIQSLGYTDVTISENDAGTGIILSDSKGREFSNQFKVLDSSSSDVSETIDVSEPEYSYTKFDINLFSGSNVKSLSFNSEVINSLDQNDLDYLASVQWKDDVSFTNRAQDSKNEDTMSFSEFYQSIRVSVSSEKESADFVLTTQTEVKQSLEATYENIVKVDKDEEMTDLIKFQAAYTASAKVITVVDEMLQTLLGIKR